MARYVRVATISSGGSGRAGAPHETVAANREAQVQLTECALLDQPDIVCLTETITSYGLTPSDLGAAAEPIDGPTVETFARLARRGRSYVVVPILTREAGSIYNSAILLDRDGNVAAVYRKRYPTLGELEWGVTPGTEAVVVNTDFGRVGLAICFDVNFRDVGEDHLAAGAELVLFPSMFPGGLFLPAWGHNFGHFMVSATPRDGSRFVDPLGRIFVQTESTYEPVVSRRINLDFRVLRMTRNLPKQEAIKQKYGPGVEIDVARDEAEMCLYSHLADRTAADILAEFGMETRADFFARYAHLRMAALREPHRPAALAVGAVEAR